MSLENTLDTQKREQSVNTTMRLIFGIFRGISYFFFRNLLLISRKCPKFAKLAKINQGSKYHIILKYFHKLTFCTDAVSAN